MATHDQYRPAQKVAFADDYPRQGYAYGQGFPSPAPVPAQSGAMTTYQPPLHPQMHSATHPSTTLAPPQQQAYHDNQAYQQNMSAFDEVYKRKPSRRPHTPEPEKPQAPQPDPRRDSSEPPPQQRGRVKASGGPLAGAAGGALIGANVGGDRFSGVGTIGGMIAGAYAGNKLEKGFKSRRQERQNLERAVAENDRDDREQVIRDEYDREYTQVAYAAPGYGSSLLPSDRSHGGRVRRNSRTSAAA